ncbi:MAG TPA: molybdopterin-dependent oxidoreductase [Humidesulfovibrio sp.]|uniref:molybdopterin-dependent oxidoreductase n=1 Tax=Humidesulfovibrio sp. TaxID=2910988 RepID=UPI002BCB2E35|nr:molybdopterin-dependent oxidoreductase [Humidesulfovibrio sp.]HWR03415.1 molybdopterin-dependent oxidoreductase [Humidesulfovibrio sp.]
MSGWNKHKMEQVLGCGLSRRDFLKGLAVGGAAALAPCLLLQPRPADANQNYEGGYQVFRNACPRNCYDTCSIKSYVKDGVVRFVEGAPESTFTRGGLCVKGNSYVRYAYSPDRIKYPMLQEGRGSGKWRRISWDEAMDRIAKKILELKQQDGSLLGLALTKYSGNFGITNYGVEGLMSSLGYTTRLVGTPCWPAGIDAQNYDLGNMWCNDPEDMAKSRYIIIWGANPAWCSIHSMKFIYAAREAGAKVVVIDPVFTQTAAKGDEYLQVVPGGDGALALGMCRHLLDGELYDKAWVAANSVGFQDFAEYLRKNVTVDWAAGVSGVPAERIRAIAEEFAHAKPGTIWIGYGMQRHVNGGAMVRAIDALVAMTGNVGKVGGGARYGHLQTWGFNYNAMIRKPPEGSKGFVGAAGPKGEFDFAAGAAAPAYTDRALNINKTAQEILDAKDPAIRMLWVSCKNVLSQDFDRNKLLEAFKKLELVVVVDHFFNQTVEQADIVLPVTTIFEEWTVNVSYWHYWLSLNEQAVKPMFEARSNIEIAAALSKRMNELTPGSCTYPTEIDTREWMEKEFNKKIYDLFGIASWEDLRKGPVKARMPQAAWSDLVFATPSKKYEFKSELCAKNGHKALPEYVEGRQPYDKLRLLTPHSKFNIHSQFQNLDWMMDFNPEPIVYIHPGAAKERAIKDGDAVRVFNKTGEVRLKARITADVPPDTLLMYEAWYKGLTFNCQNLVDDTSSDMGKFKTGAPGVAIHDQFADVARA